MDETLQVLSDSLSLIKWRLKSSSKLRLEIDMLALCTGMRPVVMIDYGGKLPELQERLCSLLKFCQKPSLYMSYKLLLNLYAGLILSSLKVCGCDQIELPIFEQLRVMLIEDMIYLIHVKGLAEHVSSSLNQVAELQFVDIEQDPPKMISRMEESDTAMQLIAVQKFFSLVFPLDGLNEGVASCSCTNHVPNAQLSDAPSFSQSSEIMDLTSCMHETQITIPTLNGWLLGYPVVYLFSKDHISDAIYNLSTQALRIFRIMIRRNHSSQKESPPEELMSFSVPCDLSLAESNEPWAQMFLSQMQSKWEKCKQTWRTLEMEVSKRPMHGIAL